jgi:hypothetical protein
VVVACIVVTAWWVVVACRVVIAWWVVVACIVVIAWWVVVACIVVTAWWVVVACRVEVLVALKVRGILDLILVPRLVLAAVSIPVAVITQVSVITLVAGATPVVVIILVVVLVLVAQKVRGILDLTLVSRIKMLNLWIVAGSNVSNSNIFISSFRDRGSTLCHTHLFKKVC